MPFRAPSAKEMAENSDFPLLPEDEYLGTVTGYEFQPQAPNPFGDPRDQYKFKIRLESFADGSPLEDSKGNPIDKEFTLNAFIDPARIGMIPQPAKARKFMAALLRQPVGDTIEIENFPDDLVGKSLLVATMNKPGKEGGEFTRPADYRAVKIERKRRAAVEEEPEKAADVEIENDEIRF